MKTKFVGLFLWMQMEMRFVEGVFLSALTVLLVLAN